MAFCGQCGTQIDGPAAFCPNCGVKAGQAKKTCPDCGTAYFTAACPNCGYTPGRKKPAEQTVIHQHIYEGPQARTAPTPTQARRVAQRRKELGLTQEALAEKANVTTQFVSYAEAGKRAMRRGAHKI